MSISNEHTDKSNVDEAIEHNENDSENINDIDSNSCDSDCDNDCDSNSCDNDCDSDCDGDCDGDCDNDCDGDCANVKSSSAPQEPIFSEDEIPGVSIITPTFNRKNTIKLSVVNFLSFDYPKNKIEWIIIDDSDEPIREILPDDERIKYYYFGAKERDILYKGYRQKLVNKNKKTSKKVTRNPHIKVGHFVNHRLPLGLKRNLGVAYAKFDYIVHMDDDDYLPKDSIKERIFKMLVDPKIQCLGCTQLNQFHTTKLTSIKTKSADDMDDASRIYECTLCYTRKFWEQQKFDSGSMFNEGTLFFKNRSILCKIIEPTKVIVSLVHQDNQKILKGYHDLQPNGWHFEPIPDELFLLITSF